MNEAESLQARRPWYRRRWLKALVLMFVLLVGGYYYLLIDRYEVRKAADGWEFTGSFVGLRCTHCTGIVRLAYKGRVLAPPLHGFQSEKRISLTMETPVVTLGSTSGALGWRYYGAPSDAFRMESDRAITDEDLHRGWYDQESMKRRQGTPAHWCLVVMHSLFRWCDPERLDDFDWPALAQTQLSPSPSAIAQEEKH